MHIAKLNVEHFPYFRQGERNKEDEVLKKHPILIVYLT